MFATRLSRTSQIPLGTGTFNLTDVYVVTGFGPFGNIQTHYSSFPDGKRLVFEVTGTPGPVAFFVHNATAECSAGSITVQLRNALGAVPERFMHGLCRRPHHPARSNA